MSGVGDLVMVRMEAAGVEEVEGVSLVTELFLVLEDPHSPEVRMENGLFYVLHPGSGLRFPVRIDEVTVVQPRARAV